MDVVQSVLNEAQTTAEAIEDRPILLTSEHIRLEIEPILARAIIEALNRTSMEAQSLCRTVEYWRRARRDGTLVRREQDKKWYNKDTRYEMEHLAAQWHRLKEVLATLDAWQSVSGRRSKDQTQGLGRQRWKLRMRRN